MSADAIRDDGLSDVLVEGGCAMGCVGSVVLGYWYCPFNAARVRACSDRYALATGRDGSFAVFSVFRVNPYSADVVGSEVRSAVGVILDTHAKNARSIVCVLQGSPLVAAAMRMSAAATTLITGNKALRFVSTFDEGLAAMALDPHVPPPDRLVQHMREIERAAASTAPPGVCDRAGRPAWRA